jgi:transposase
MPPDVPRHSEPSTSWRSPRLRHAHNIRLTPVDRATLEQRLLEHSLPSNLRLRATALLMSDKGMTPSRIARMLGVSLCAVSTWRTLFVRKGIAGLMERKPRRPPHRKYGLEVKAAILRLAATEPPTGERWWTAKLIAAQLDGIPKRFVWQVINSAGIDLRAGRRRTYRY